MNINPDSARDIPCKNVLIYGYCKYENKGCAFAHPASSKSSTIKTNSANASTIATGDATDASPPAEPKRKFNMNTPSFQPSVSGLTNKFSALSPKLKEIPVFVPASMESSENPITQSSIANVSTATNSGSTGVPGASVNASTPAENNSPFTSRKFNVSTPSFTPSNTTEAPLSSPAANFTSSAPTQPKLANPYASSSAADFMYHHSSGASAYPLHHHLYAPAPPPRLAMPLGRHETNASAMFIPNDLRELLTRKNEATLQTMPHSTLPDHVGVYHTLVPIDSSFDNVSKEYHLPSHVYKVLSNADGLPYAMRRIDYGTSLRIVNELPFRTVKRWRSVKNPNVIHLQDAFTSVAFSTQGEPSLCLVYDYYPLADTLSERHLSRKLGSKLEPVTEDLLWTYAIQITGALLDIHQAGLYAGSSISLSKILVTNKNRVRLGAVCVDDILEFENLDSERNEIGSEAVVEKLQLGDIIRFGKIILDLAATTLPAGLRNGSIEEMIVNLSRSSSTSFSGEFLETLRVLNSAESEFSLINFYTRYLSQRALKLINGLQDSTDYYEGQLSSELENARLFRLMTKIDYLLSQSDKEDEVNGNLFVIKLFRDFVFQTTDETGKPKVDLSRVLVNLNKLDVGVDEKILLVSREEDSCLMVSYKEIKDIMDQTFRNIFR
ncbi:putative PAB-dependent poly(A)-specific ribonuclease subunit [Clavispora lusitaniae]|uniref:PAN2-PAN3 deadenylation complex subunit PAN3 n=1 Tax=Clavispora lusitaniae TaxID=36911 RepID=A0AA91Q1E1_CLALS|nr:putative PAB-dependent poly(A)-specific ribonuclease subunit [Clavispora lusitaniae]